MSAYSASIKSVSSSYHPGSISSAGYSSWGTLSTAGVPPTPGTPVHSTIPLPLCSPISSSTRIHPTLQQRQHNLRAPPPAADPSYAQDATYPPTAALPVSLVPSQAGLAPIPLTIASRSGPGARLTVYEVLEQLAAALMRPVDQANPNAMANEARVAFYARTKHDQGAYARGMILADAVGGAWGVVEVRMKTSGVLEVRLA
ncbi:hypothetical protein H0H92_011407 [Tricholoma furcatifolium]|nr:hypothetical protein H0H92_011407 [Tricholoma furcatifolium]